MVFFEAPILCSFLFNEFSDDILDNGKSERQDGFSNVSHMEPIVEDQRTRG
jgi:hypothetical protein